MNKPVYRSVLCIGSRKSNDCTLMAFNGSDWNCHSEKTLCPEKHWTIVDAPCNNKTLSLPNTHFSISLSFYLSLTMIRAFSLSSHRLTLTHTHTHTHTHNICLPISQTHSSIHRYFLSHALSVTHIHSHFLSLTLSSHPGLWSLAFIEELPLPPPITKIPDIPDFFSK